jgi:hypothetical protein
MLYESAMPMFELSLSRSALSEPQLRGVMRRAIRTLMCRLTLEIEDSPVGGENKARVRCLLREYAHANWEMAGAIFAAAGYQSGPAQIQFQNDDPLD